MLTLILSGCGAHPAKPPPPATSAITADYVDLSSAAGLKYRWVHRARGPWTNLQAFGSGCAFIDVDHDGWMEIFFAGDGSCALFHNNHDGTFTDVSEKAGVRKPGKWTGIAVGDYDNDGYEDVYVSGYHCSMLLHNRRDGTFEDVTGRAGLTEHTWGTSAAFFDADGDGKLDLLVGHYVATGGKYPWYCHPSPGITTGCRPDVYPAEYPKLYHNNGNGTFKEVTAASGLDRSYGKSLAIQLCDYDNDGKLDFYIANDGVAGDMFHNLGGGRFENVSLTAGTAFDMAGVPQAGMGVDFADYDHDGRMDMVVTAFSDETFSLYHNLDGIFEDASTEVGLGITRNYLGFGVKFIDFNNDTWPDLAFANGHVYDNAVLLKQGTFRQRMLLFANERGRYAQVTHAGPGFEEPIVGRGLAVGDPENRGDQDLLVVDIDGHPLLLHNRETYGNHWLGLKLIGSPSNRDGIGARVTVKAGATTMMSDCSLAGSYLSSMDPRLHFGLGQANRVESVDVRWPDGRHTQLRNVAADRYTTVTEATDVDRRPTVSIGRTPSSVN